MKQERTLIHDFTEGPILSQLFRFGAPFILSNLLQTVYNLVDMIVVGQVLGSSGLSAVATGGELLNMFTFVCMGLTTAGQVVIAQLIGRKQTDQLQHFIGTMFSALTVAAIAFSAVGMLLSDWFMRLLNVPPEAKVYAQQYILVCFIGLIFIYGYNTVSAILRGMGDSHHPLLFIAVASITNLILDIVFVVAFRMGAMGAALATVMGQGLSFLLSMWFLYRNRGATAFDFKPNRFLIHRQPLWMLLKLGIPMSLQFAAINVSNLYINAAVNSFGVVCSAVSGVGTKLNSIMSIVAAALISAGATMVGQNFGAEKLDRIRRVFYSIMTVTVSFSLILGAVMLLFPHQVFRLFSQDADVLAMAASYAPVAALCFLGAGLRSPAIDFEMLAETSYEETLNLRMASQDYPDIFSQSVASYQQKLEKAIDEDILIDFNDYLEYAPDWANLLERNETYRENITNSDGSIAQIVNCTLGKSTQQGLIRGDWLKELGMDTPTTIDELTDVLRVFKEKYGTTNALLINSDLDSAAEFAFNFTAQGFKMLSFQLKEPGSTEVIAGVATEAYVEYLEYLHSLYEEGLITDDFVSTSKENGNWESSFYSGACGVWQDDCKYADSSYAAMADDSNWDAVPFAFTGEDYHMVSVNPVGLTTTYVSTTCSEPEVAVEFLNYGFTEEGRKLVNYGVEGETYTVDDNGDIAFTDLMLNNPDGYTFDQAQVLYLVANWMPTEQDDSYLKINYTEDAIEAINLWSSTGDSTMTIPQAAQPGGDDMMEIFTMASDSLTYLSTVAPKVILGTATADDYRAAVQECMDGMNLDVITEKYQAAYDAFMGN